MKCIVLGAFTFPTPFLILIYLLNLKSPKPTDRVLIVLFLLVAGGVVGLVSYFRSKEMEEKKDWIPSSNDDSRFFRKPNG